MQGLLGSEACHSRLQATHLHRQPAVVHANGVDAKVYFMRDRWAQLRGGVSRADMCPNTCITLWSCTARQGHLVCRRLERALPCRLPLLVPSPACRVKTYAAFCYFLLGATPGPRTYGHPPGLDLKGQRTNSSTGRTIASPWFLDKPGHSIYSNQVGHDEWQNAMGCHQGSMSSRRGLQHLVGRLGSREGA